MTSTNIWNFFTPSTIVTALMTQVKLSGFGLPLVRKSFMDGPKENRSVYRVAAPVADAVEIAAAVETGVGRPTCFGDVAPLVSCGSRIKFQIRFRDALKVGPRLCENEVKK